MAVAEVFALTGLSWPVAFALSLLGLMLIVENSDLALMDFAWL